MIGPSKLVTNLLLFFCFTKNWTQILKSWWLGKEKYLFYVNGKLHFTPKTCPV